MDKKHLFYILVCVTAFTTIISNSISTVDIILQICSTIMMIFILNKYSFQANVGKFMTLGGFWASVVFIPAFHLGIQFGLGSNELLPYDYNLAASFGSKVIFVTCIAWFICGREPEFEEQDIVYCPSEISSINVYIMFTIMFMLTSFSYAIGLGRMGADTVVLPFHLGGIINLARKTLFPALFAIVIENHLLNDKKIPAAYFLLFFVWSIFEMFTWLSKSILVMNFLPVFLIIILYLKPSIKNIAKVAIPFFLLFMTFYPLIAAMRSADKGHSFTEYMVNAINLADEDNEDAANQSPFIAPLNRTFITTGQFTKDYQYINNYEIFDFSRVPILFAMGGAAKYQTHIVDGYGLTVNHSSGTSGLMDPLLHGGYGLCYLMIIIIMLFSQFVDSQIPKKQYSILIQLLLILYSFVLVKNISGFYDGVGISTILSQVFTIVIASKMNYKYQLEV